MTTMCTSRRAPAMLSALLALAVATLVASPLPAAGQVATPEPVTYTKDIAPILQRSCQRCHNPDSVAPMSLLTYEEVRPWARAMKYRTGLRSQPAAMPPWYIEKDIGIQDYKGDISLSEEEIAKIAMWADNGAVRGNPADLPPPITLVGANEWQIGEPDLILQTPTVELGATAPDWWGPIGETPTGLTEDRFVSAIEMKEVNDFEGDTDRQTIGGLYIIHHLIFSAVGADGEPEDEEFRRWPVHEVGRNADFLHPDAGLRLKAGSKLNFTSAHLHSNGSHTRAHLDIGLKFHPKGYEPKRRMRRIGPSTLDLDIKGMEADQRFEAFSTLPEHTKMTLFEPHLHAAGVRMCLDAIWGSQVETLSCAGYNHSWVRIYSYADDAAPLLPKGTILRITGYFDNTLANPNVSDPRNWSGLGHRSIDNMMINIGQGFYLSDEEFEQELAERREKLQLTKGETAPGCPLCGGFSTFSDTVENAENQQP